VKTFTTIALLTQLFACSDAGFQSGSNTKKKDQSAPAPIAAAPKSDNAKPKIDNAKPKIETALAVEDLVSSQKLDARANIPVCTTTSNRPKVSFHVPYTAEPGNPGASQWLFYSDVFKADISDLSGKYLPVTQFIIDDLTFLVGATDSIEQTGNIPVINFKIPKGGFLLSDPRSPTGQSGGFLTPAPTVLSTKVYSVDGKTVTVPKNTPGNAMWFLKDLIPLGMPTTPFDKVSLADLRSKGFIDDKGILSFRLVTIPHGAGSLDITLEVKECAK